MNHKIDKLTYENALGTIVLKNITVDLEQDQIERLKNGEAIEDLDYGLYGTDIEKAERKIAQKFFKEKYRDILTGVYELNSDEIQSIQDLLDMNRLQFAKVIGLDRGSLVNIYKRNSCSQPVQILIIQRMKM